MKPSKLLPLMLLWILSVNILVAQGWERSFNLGSTQSATNVVTTGGGYVVSGFSNAAPDSGGYNFFLLKTDEHGNTLWSYISNLSNLYPTGMIAAANGDIVLCGYTTNKGQAYLARFSAAGDSLWYKTYGANGSFKPTSLVETSTGNLLLAVNWVSADTTDTIYGPMTMLFNAAGDSLRSELIYGNGPEHFQISALVNTFDHQVMAAGTYTNVEVPYFLKLDESGDTVWSAYTGIPIPPSYNPFDIIQTHDSGYVMTGVALGGTNQPRSFLVKADKNGALLWHRFYLDSAYYTYAYGVLEDSAGRLILADNRQTFNGVQPAQDYPVFRILDPAGNQLKTKTFNGTLPNFQRYLQGAAHALNGGYILAGAAGNNNIYLVNTDSIGNVYPAHISGHVFFDQNQDCTFNNNELGLANWIVQAANVDTFYAVTDNAGNYTIDCNTGAYNLSVQCASNYWTDTHCPADLLVNVPLNADTVFQNIAATAVVSSPYMQVQVSALPLRRCSSHTLPYNVSYTNAGTQAATNAYIDITLDMYLMLDSASNNITYSSLGNNVYRFPLGTVGVNQWGSFKFYVFTSCDQPQPGMTHCVEAHIYPDTVATTNNPLWDGSELVLSAKCDTDTVQFAIKNVGNNMGHERLYAIIQDDILFVTGAVQLTTGQIFTRTVPANGSTWTLTAQQAVGYPGGGNMPLISLEGCGVNGSGRFDVGYVPMFPQNDGSSFINTLCLQDVGSYDPNAKMPEPLGIGAAGLIDASQKLNYIISFQNTGTDTAFIVSVVDTLSPLLDITTLHVVNSSAPYTWSIRPGNVVVFVFSGINLPDSGANEAMSHGLISFTINPVAGLPGGTQINNTSYIYFDQNAPVQTNVTLNTIGQLFSTWLAVTEVHDEAHIVNCYPNPNEGQLTLEYKGSANDAVFQIFDITGNEVFVQKVSAGVQQLNISNLSGGLYLYQLTSGSSAASGKIIKF